MKRKLFFLIALLMAFAVSGNDFLEWRAKLTTKADAPRGHAAFVQLDSEIYSKIGSIGSDLRVTTPDGTPVPSFVKSDTKPEGKCNYRSVPSKLTGFEEKNNTGFFTVENLQKKPVGRIEVITSFRDFFKTMSVEKSEDGKSWKPVGTAVKVFDYSRHIDFSEKTINFEPVSSRFFRVRLDNFVEKIPDREVTVVNTSGGKTETVTVRSKSIRIDRLDLQTPDDTPRRKAVNIPYPVISKSVAENGRNTVIEIETQGEPLAGFEFSAADTAFSRRVKIFGEDSEGNMVLIGTDLIERLPSAGRPLHEKLKVNLSGINCTRHFRLEIFNGDAAPLKDIKAGGFGLCYKLYFYADQPAYMLYYGKGAPSQESDAQIILEKDGLANAVEYVRGTPEHNPNFRTDKWAAIKQYIPTLTLIVLIIAVVIALWRVFQNADKNEE